ncbi:MAG TPA: TonB family protein [Oligoflexia bacterium]|nr:TonB family protein [Oligoflexia bacterium]HMP27628.1 TonB family protein [Oligoflexia bacterium]
MLKNSESEINIISLALSAALHLLLLFTFSSTRFKPNTPANIIFNVGFIEEPAAPNLREQIVSEPDTKQQEALNKDAKLLTDKNYVTEREQIRRGLDQGIQAKAQGNATLKEHNYSEQKEKLTKAKNDQNNRNKQRGETTENNEQNSNQIKKLTLDQQAVEKVISSAVAARASSISNNSLESYQAFSRASGSGAAFLGSGSSLGAPDYLPNLPDGDITLLNAKASQFAVFVRRVATQVFGALRQTGWETLSAAEISRIGGFTTISATLNLKGELISLSLESGSGSIKFDQAVLLAAKQGARDQNPPAAAARGDGKITFIFKARTWSRFGYDARSRFPTERRWLLLATGLE